MAKQRINLCIDGDVYLRLKQQVGDGKISTLTNEFYRQFLSSQGVNTEEHELLDKLEQRNKEIEQARQEVMELSTQLIIFREKRQKEAVEQEKNAQLLHDALRLNNPLRNL